MPVTRTATPAHHRFNQRHTSQQHQTTKKDAHRGPPVRSSCYSFRHTPRCAKEVLALHHQAELGAERQVEHLPAQAELGRQVERLPAQAELAAGLQALAPLVLSVLRLPPVPRFLLRVYVSKYHIAIT